MDNKEKKELDINKVKVYDLFSMVVIRFLFAISSIVAFFIVLSYLIKASTPFEASKFGVVDTFLGGVNVYVLNHYFGKKNKK
jgi:hypothetical protein